MSRIDFDSLIAEQPQLKSAWRKLRAWLAEHPTVSVVEASRLSRELRAVPPEQLATALRTLVDDGAVKQQYAVVGPSGTLLDPAFDRPDLIPSELEDRFGERFLTESAPVVVVLILPIAPTSERV